MSRQTKQKDKIQDGGTVAMTLQGAMTIYTVQQRKTALFKALDAASDLQLNLSRVEEMDTAGVQLLILVKREATKAGKTVRLVEHSAATLQALDHYNLTSYFGDPVVLVSDSK